MTLFTLNFQYIVIHSFTVKTARIRFGNDIYNDFLYVGVRESIFVRHCQSDLV